MLKALFYLLYTIKLQQQMHLYPKALYTTDLDLSFDVYKVFVNQPTYLSNLNIKTIVMKTEVAE